MSGIGDFVSTIQELRKQVFDKEMKDDVPRASDVATMFMSKGRKIDLGGLGLNCKLAIRNATGAIAGALTEGGAYPSPGFQSGITPVMTCTHAVAAVGWTGHVIAMGSSEKASFDQMTEIKRSLSDLKEKMKRTIARFLMWSGTAVLGTTAAASGTTGGYFTLASGACPINFFEAGDIVTLRNATSGGTELLTNAATGAGRILQILDDLATPRVILTDATGATAGGGDTIAWANFYDTTVIEGLRSMVLNSGTFMGLARATGANAAMRALLIDAGGASVQPNDPDRLRDKVWERAHLKGEYNLKWICNPRTRRSFVETTRGMVRWASLEKQELGTTTLNVNDKDGSKELMTDSYLIDGELFVIDPSKLLYGCPEGMEGAQVAENAAGSPVFQLMDASYVYDKFRSYATWRGQYGLEECHSSGKFYNFTPGT